MMGWTADMYLFVNFKLKYIYALFVLMLLVCWSADYSLPVVLLGRVMNEIKNK